MDALDAGEILSHLNHLGYRNITIVQLKEFQKDLKKLIRYDAKQCAENDGSEDGNAAPETVFDRLHTETTASYLAKHSRPKHTEPAAVPVDKENLTPTHKTAPCKNNQIANKMWIRPKSSQSIRRSDPVALYHSYKKEWNKYKQKLPGENDHSELRWKIRNKLLGEQ
uniref:HYLS1_C domain-containing protein n=1 Tax=Anopheles minimus TaxID=112268 RepID=A0A182W9N7_9DIPT